MGVGGPFAFSRLNLEFSNLANSTEVFEMRPVLLFADSLPNFLTGCGPFDRGATLEKTKHRRLCG